MIAEQAILHALTRARLALAAAGSSTVCAMFGIGGVEVILFTLILWALGIWAAYWLIRVGVRHGTLDALRQDRLEQERRSAARESRPLP